MPTGHGCHIKLQLQLRSTCTTCPVCSCKHCKCHSTAHLAEGLGLAEAAEGDAGLGLGLGVAPGLAGVAGRQR
jgi:hypothetical protein